jgi:hypothetical protein
MGEQRFYCQACALERPVSLRVIVQIRQRNGRTVPMVRCTRCFNRERPIKERGKNGTGQ